MPNTALGLVLLGIAGALRHREGTTGVRHAVSLVIGLAALVIGAATLAEYALGINLHLDQLLVSVPDQAGPYRGRPSPPTALALTALGAAILLLDARPTARARPSEWLALLAGVIGFTALLGQLLGAEPLYRLSAVPVIGVAVPTALGLLLLSVGLLLERPRAGVMAVLSSPGPGGFMLRRLGLVAILAPVALGLIGVRLLVRHGAEQIPLVFATLAVALTVASLILLTLTAIRLDRTHAALETTRAATRALIEQASEGIFLADLEGRYTDINSAGCEMLGYSREELVGKTILDLIPQADIERLAQVKQRLLAGGTDVGDWTLRRKDGTVLPVEVSAKILPDGRWQGFVRDISERKQAGERARLAQERLELALRGADLASWDWNVKTGEVIFNSRWAEMRGHRPEEIRPHVDTWIAGVHPEDWPRVQKAVADCFDGRVPDYETEHRVRTKSGDWIWTLDRGRVFARDEQGQPLRMVGTELDITERRRAEEALRLSEAKSSGILSISADAIVSVDERQRITMFNEGAEKIFGYSRQEVLGAPLELLIPERLRALHRQHVERFADSADVARRMGDQRRAPIWGLRKDGSEFPADAAISRLVVGGRRLLTVALRDITEQRQIENEKAFLSEVDSVLASAIDYDDTLARIAQLAVKSLADLCIVDIMGQDDVRRVKVASRDSSRAPICELLTRIPLERKPQQLLWTVLETKRPVLVQGPSPDMIRALSQDEAHRGALGDLALRSVLAMPLLAGEKVLGAMVLVATAPSRPHGPAEVRLTEQLADRAGLAMQRAHLYRVAQRAIQARDDVLGVVAHDLRNPLGIILLQSERLRRRGGEPEQASQKALDTIERAATRMDHLIQDLLDVTRMDAGRLTVEQTRLSPRRIIVESVEAQMPLATRASLELHSEVARDLPEVWADRDRLLQVFENLIGNAIKFTKDGGRIAIGAAPRDGEVQFWVADTGLGVAPENLPHLFDRFWQARKAGRRGAGLGLPIVKGIVEAHGGRIWVESAPGRGTTFFFTIPAAPAAEEWRREQAAP